MAKKNRNKLLISLLVIACIIPFVFLWIFLAAMSAPML